MLLCRTCHSWCHQHPEAARTAGLIVSRHVQEPGSIPVQALRGERTLACMSTEFTYTNSKQFRV